MILLIPMSYVKAWLQLTTQSSRLGQSPVLSTGLCMGGYASKLRSILYSPYRYDTSKILAHLGMWLKLRFFSLGDHAISVCRPYERKCYL